MDGVSLTVFDKHDKELHSSYSETRRSTILSSKKLGDKVHLKTDVLFKYVENILNKDKDQLSVDKLRAFGF